VLDVNGLGTNSLTIPSNPVLVGLVLVFQSAVFTPTIELTNAVDGPIAVY
jgi:hypothetical protein